MPGIADGFGRVWTASTVSAFGSAVTTVAIPVLVVQTLHEGAAGVGLVGAARWAPYLLLGVVVGVLVERRRRRPLLIGTDLGRPAALLAIPLLAAAGALTLGALMAIMAVFGLLSLVGDAAAQSFLPRLVPPNRLTAANARLDQGDAVAQTSGPALGGGLVALLGAPVAVLVDAASYVASGLLLLRLPVEEPPGSRTSLRGIGAEAMEGLRYVYRNPALAPLALGTHGWFVCAAVTGAVLAPFALGTVALSAFGFGLAVAAAGVGSVLGSLAAERLGRRFGVGRLVIACWTLAGIGVAVVALTPPAGGLVLAGGQLLLGMSMGAENANTLGYRQAVTPDRLQSRMNTTMRSINRAMIVVGAPVGGFVADAIGYRVTLGAAAVGFVVMAAALAATRFRGARTPVGPG